MEVPVYIIAVGTPTCTRWDRVAMVCKSAIAAAKAICKGKTYPVFLTRGQSGAEEMVLEFAKKINIQARPFDCKGDERRLHEYVYSRSQEVGLIKTPLTISFTNGESDFVKKTTALASEFAEFLLSYDEQDDDVTTSDFSIDE